MATRTTVDVIDDFDFTEGAETRAFGFEGVDYEIDLTDKNYQKMRKDFARYVESARRVNRRGRRKRSETSKADGSTAKKAPGSKEQNDAIRAWARSKGKQISSRGRIPQDIIDSFHAEAGSTPAFSSP